MTGRDCAECGQAYGQANPQQRYCSSRCRRAAWRHRHPRPHRPVPIPKDAVPTVPSSGDAVSTPHARCPHCRRPVAVLTLLVDPAAAHVLVPDTPPL